MNNRIKNDNPGQKKTRRVEYNHADWENKRRFLRFLLKTLAFTLLVRLERVEGLENIPKSGPGILLMNHIGWVDPIVLVHITPRYIVPLAKVEVYDYPVIGIFPRLWGVIPVQREGVDRQAVQGALNVLNQQEIILVAPEGTRNPTLQQGKGGFAYLASRSGAPIIPVTIEIPCITALIESYGFEGYCKFRRPVIIPLMNIPLPSIVPTLLPVLYPTSPVCNKRFPSGTHHVQTKNKCVCIIRISIKDQGDIVLIAETEIPLKGCNNKIRPD